MALTRTNTTTRTYTRARMHLVRIQFKSFATRFGYSPGCIEGLPDAIDQRLIADLAVYALDRAGEAVASVVLRIDWVSHDELRETTEVSIDERWRNDVSPQLEIYDEGFEAFVREFDLTLDCRIGLTDLCEADAALYQLAMDRLELQDAGPVQWRGRPVGDAERLRGLSEMSVEVSFVDDGR